MKTYSTYDLQTGLFTGTHITTDQGSLDANVPVGFSLLLGEFDHLTQRVQISDHTVVEYLPPAAPAFALDYVKSQTWLRIKKVRGTLEAGNFAMGNNVFKVDQNITTNALDAMLAKQSGEAWTLAWVLADNTSVTLSADAMIAVARAMKAYITQVFDTSQRLRAQVASATTSDEVNSITWPTT